MVHSYKGTLYSSENEQTIAAGNNTYQPHKYKFKEKKPGRKEYTLNEFIYMSSHTANASVGHEKSAVVVDGEQ